MRAVSHVVTPGHVDAVLSGVTVASAAAPGSQIPRNHTDRVGECGRPGWLIEKGEHYMKCEECVTCWGAVSTCCRQLIVPFPGVLDLRIPPWNRAAHVLHRRPAGSSDSGLGLQDGPVG